MSGGTLALLAASLGAGIGFFSIAQWIPEEGKRREAVCRKSEAAHSFIQEHSREIEAARERIAQWEECVAGPAEARLVDAVSRFQRRRDDFRLVGLSRAPEGVLLEVECRSQAAVEFLLFCDQELLDLVPARISLGCPPATRVGSLRAEIAFRGLAHPGAVSAASTPPPSGTPPPLSIKNPRPSDLGLRQ
ncbi:MAG: hypothetical protein AB7T14_09430 [Candidatus Methylacidiphilaceae bacterium]